MEITVNLFNNGLNLDQHPLTIDNTTLTDALNATILTKNGNELMLQNDMGNTLIQDSRTGRIMGLSEGFIPLGMKEYGGVLYIASYNPDTEEGELGSIPSPLITYAIGQVLKRENIDIDLINKDYDIDELDKSTVNNYVKISDCRLKPGDAFYIVLELERKVDEIKREDEICGYIEDNKLILVPKEKEETVLPNTNNLCIKDNINKSIFSCSDLGKGLFDVELYTKTQSHGILPLEGIQEKEVLYYVKNDIQVKNSDYWFIDKCKIKALDLDSDLFDKDGVLSLDMKRSISAESFLNYPNYPDGYLCTKLSPIIPEIDGMLVNKSTGIKSPYLYIGTREKKYKTDTPKLNDIQFYKLGYREDDEVIDGNDTVGNWIYKWKTTDDNEITKCPEDNKENINQVGDILSEEIIFAVYKIDNTYYFLQLLKDLETIKVTKIDKHANELLYYKFLTYLAVQNGFNENNNSCDFSKYSFITKILPQTSNYYKIIVPGFYCNSGVLTIDKIKLVEVTKNDVAWYRNEWEDKEITRLRELKGELIDIEYNKDKKIVNRTNFIQIFDNNTKCNKSIICPDNADSIINMLGENSTNHPGDMNSSDNDGLFAFLIEEKDLNSTFKMTFEFYSYVPKLLYEYDKINESFTWKLDDENRYECKVVTKTFSYTPRAIELDSYSIYKADDILLEWEDVNTPEIKLNEGVLFGLKDGLVLDYKDDGSKKLNYGAYDEAKMCTSYLYPYVQFDLDSDAIKGCRMCLGGFGLDKSDWGKTMYSAGVYAEVKPFKSFPYHYYNNTKGYRSYCQKTWGSYDSDYKYLNHPLNVTTIKELHDKGLYNCNMNWFKNNTVSIDYAYGNGYTAWLIQPWDIRYAWWHKRLYCGGIKNHPDSNRLMHALPCTNFIETEGIYIKNYDKGIQYLAKSSVDNSEKNVKGWKHHNSNNWISWTLSNDLWFACNSYPKYTINGGNIESSLKRYGCGRYIEFLYCWMRTFEPNAPIMAKGWTDNNTPYKLFNSNYNKEFDLLAGGSTFTNNLSYLYKKAFKIKIINKSKNVFKYYQLMNDSGNEKLAGIISCSAILKTYDNIDGSEYNLVEPVANLPIYNRVGNKNYGYTTPTNLYLNILSKEFKFNININAAITRADYNQILPGLVSIIPSYQFFLNLDDIELKKNKKTDRIITPYFYVANNKNLPFNSNLGAELDRLVSEQTCNGEPWKYDISDIKSYKTMQKHGKVEEWKKITVGESLPIHIEKKVGNQEGFPDVLESSLHILKVNGCCYYNNHCVFDKLVTIKTCEINFYKGQEEIPNSKISFENNNEYNVSDYLMYNIPSDCTRYKIELTFDSDVLIKSIYGFDYLLNDQEVSKKEEKELNKGFYFQEKNDKKELYPLFPEYYVYCENGIKCANETFSDIPKYPDNKYARVYGYYTINMNTYKDFDGKPDTNKTNDMNDYYYSGSPIPYSEVKKWDTTNIPMKTIETYSSCYKD